jgi:dienelactone hydrolase
VALLAVLAVLAVALSLTLLWRSGSGVVIEQRWLDSTPVTFYRPDAALIDQSGQAWNDPASNGLPVVLISHGFAGSTQLMESFALALARNGYLVASFDYFGHGRNLEPLRGDVMDVEGATRFLVEQTRAVADFALDQPDAASELAILGHSMASDIIVRFAQSDPRVEAVVALSMFSPAVTADSPDNLLVLVGDLEGRLKGEALRVVSLVADEAEAGVTYGSFGDGSARRAVFPPGVEHVGILYSPTAVRESIDWLNRSFGRSATAGTDPVNARGPAILLLFIGLLLLAWPLSRLLPRTVDSQRGLNPTWRELLPAALIPAVATPLLLVAFPPDFMGVLVGGYLAVHFALYGLITAAACLWIRHRRGSGPMPMEGRRRAGTALLAALAASLYAAGAIGLAMDQFVTSFMVTAPRLPLLLMMLGGTLIYFLADEWLTRGPDVPRGTHLLTRICFLFSLGLAVALSFEELFFLLIIAVVIIPYFLIYGLFSRWVYKATGDPLVSALPSAAAFGWTLAVVFPQLSG